MSLIYSCFCDTYCLVCVHALGQTFLECPGVHTYLSVSHHAAHNTSEPTRGFLNYAEALKSAERGNSVRADLCVLGSVTETWGTLCGGDKRVIYQESCKIPER